GLGPDAERMRVREPRIRPVDVTALAEVLVSLVELQLVDVSPDVALRDVSGRSRADVERRRADLDLGLAVLAEQGPRVQGQPGHGCPRRLRRSVAGVVLIFALVVRSVMVEHRSAGVSPARGSEQG